MELTVTDTFRLAFQTQDKNSEEVEYTKQMVFGQGYRFKTSIDFKN